MANISIINLTEREEKKRKDINTYKRLVEKISSEIRDKGLEICVEEGASKFPIFELKNHSKTRSYALISADSLRCNDYISNINIVVHNNKVLNSIINVSNNYKDEFYFVNEINITHI